MPKFMGLGGKENKPKEEEVPKEPPKTGQRQYLVSRASAPKLSSTANLAEDLEKLKQANQETKAEPEPSPKAPEPKAPEDAKSDADEKSKDDGKDKSPEKSQVKREKLREELIATERTYAKGLELLQLYYLTAVDVVRQNESSFGASATDVSALEISLPTLCTLHNQLLADMQAAEPEKLPAVVSKYAPTFACYRDYLSRYEAALTVMEKLKKKKKFKELIEAVDSKLNEEGGGKRLLDFLITPVQRLPRYVMLLAELLKNTEEETPQYAELKAAHAKLHEIVVAVNEGKRKNEGLQKLQEIQVLLKDMPADFTWPPHRTLLREGKLKVTMESFTGQAQSLKLSERLLFLFSDKLLLARTDHTYKFDVMISSITVEIIPESETDFTVTNSKMSVCFRCDSSDERASWVRDLETTKEALKDQRGTKRLIRADLKKRDTLTKGIAANFVQEMAKLSHSRSGSHADDDDDDEKKSPDEQKRKKVCEDLLAGEQSCVSGLNILKTCYLSAVDSVRGNPSDFGATATDPPALEINLPTLLALHSQMLKDLQQDGDPDKVVSIINKHSPAFSCYGEYLPKYEAALQVMERLKKKTKFAKLIQEVDKKLVKEGIEKRLLDYLLFPVQKLFTFVGLVSELLKTTTDNLELKSSYAKLYETAMIVKEGKRQMENTTKMLEVQASLKDVPKDFAWPPGRVLVREGKLKVAMEAFSKKAVSLKVSERLLYLFSDKILVARVDHCYRYDANIASLVVDIIPESPTDFTMTNSMMSVCFRCDSVEDRAAWVKDLETLKEASKAERAQLLNRRNASIGRASQAGLPPPEEDAS